MKVSYAQRLEDYHLDLVFHDVVKGTYVDIGGGHPVADNVSFHFYLKGWHGLVVEPQAALAGLYSHVRPRDITLRTLVGRTEGEVTFHQVEGMHGFSTTVPENAATAAGFGARVETIKLPMTTLARLAGDHGLASVEFLKIDVEGAEADVLAGNNWQRFRPRVVVVEAVTPGSMAPAWDWEPMLLANGYRFAFFDELNRFYVANEAAALAARFPAAPAPWDIAEHPWDYGRADANPRHPDHALARHLVRGLLTLAPSMQPELLQRLLEAGGGLAGEPSAIAARLLGTAEHPAPDEPVDALDLFKLMDGDRFRAALGRIAAAYDGGFVMDE